MCPGTAGTMGEGAGVCNTEGVNYDLRGNRSGCGSQEGRLHRKGSGGVATGGGVAKEAAKKLP